MADGDTPVVTTTTSSDPIILPTNAFNDLVLDVGVLLSEFTPAASLSIDTTKIISATTGGINIKCTPDFEDFAEDVDNAPNNTKEFKRITGWTCEADTTLLDLTTASAKWMLGAADVDGTNTSEVVPRKDVSASDFGDLWWVGKKADGGYVAVKIINALSTGGLSIQVTKNGKGTFPVTITGHVALASPTVVPMQVYVYAAPAQNSGGGGGGGGSGT